MIHNNTWNHLTFLTKLNSRKLNWFWHLNCVLMQNWIVWNKTVYMYKMDLVLTDTQWLICHKTKPNQTKGCIHPGKLSGDWQMNFSLGQYWLYCCSTTHPVPCGRLQGDHRQENWDLIVGLSEIRIVDRYPCHDSERLAPKSILRCFTHSHSGQDQPE